MRGSMYVEKVESGRRARSAERDELRFRAGALVDVAESEADVDSAPVVSEAVANVYLQSAGGGTRWQERGDGGEDLVERFRRAKVCCRQDWCV